MNSALRASALIECARRLPWLRPSHVLCALVQVLVQVLVLSLLAACALPVRAPVAAPAVIQPEAGGAVLVVRLLGRFDAPPALGIELLPRGQGTAVTVVGRLHQGIPGQFADYLFALPLAEGDYTFGALREAGARVGAGAAPLAVLGSRLSLSPRATLYLGRLTVRGESGAVAEMVIEDHFEAESLLFRTAVPALRNASIARGQPAHEAPRATAPAGGTAGEELRVEPIAADAALRLAPAARAGFARFSRLAQPRAFAANEAGAFGYASGRDAVELALKDCARLARAKPCKLFAVDQTMVAERRP